LGCYGVELTRHGRERVQGGAGEGNEDHLPVRQFRELVIVEDWNLDRGEVKPLAGLTNEVAYVEVGLIEFRLGRLARRSSGGVPRRGERREVFHRDDRGSGTRSLKGRGT